MRFVPHRILRGLAIASAFIAGAYVFAQTLNGYLAAAAGGIVGGVVSTGTLEGGLWGAVTGLAFAGIGTITQGWDSGWALAGKGLAHGATAGAFNEAQGGEFRYGLSSGFFTTVASPIIGDVRPGAGRVVAAAVVGGTSSRLAGGKFANGAVTGAFIRLFNDCAHGSCGRVEREFDKADRADTQWKLRGTVVGYGRTERFETGPGDIKVTAFDTAASPHVRNFRYEFTVSPVVVQDGLRFVNIYEGAALTAAYGAVGTERIILGDTSAQRWRWTFKIVDTARTGCDNCGQPALMIHERTP